MIRYDQFEKYKEVSNILFNYILLLLPLHINFKKISI